jgi:hypothetical protein
MVVPAKRNYSVLLEGVDARDLSVGVLRDLCDLFLEGAQRSARLVAEGRSGARGPAPAWLTSAADLRISKFEPGSLDLELQAPRLSDVAPEIFAQQQLFPAGTSADASAFDLFLDAAQDAAQGKRDSERLDAGVLDILGRASALFARGGTRLTIAGAGRASIVLDPPAAQTIRALADETPPSRVTRVRGVLDTLTVSTKSLMLRLEDGRQLRGFATDVAIETLKELHGKDTVLEGHVTFRPSGEALRIQVEAAFAAKAGDVLWTQLPKVEPAVTRPRASVAPVGLDAFFGKWPGDETDDELATALEDLS